MNEDLIGEEGDSDSEDEHKALIHEMIYKANTETKTLFRSEVSQSDMSQEISFGSGQDQTARALLANGEEDDDDDEGE